MDPAFGERRPPKGPIASAKDPMGKGLPSGATLAVVENQEVDLVENVLNHRAQYHQGLEELRDYYLAHGYASKQSWADFELAGLRKVKSFRYLIDAEIPSDQLRPTEKVPEADALYERGRSLLRKGGSGIPIFYREKTMIEAADAFQQLVEQYPNSDKIDDAAFFLGEIHKEYLPNQEQIAVKWYERAWTWDPQTPHAARFQAAVVYDYRLHDRDRALELYQSVLKNETGDQTNVRFATRRIHELTTARQTATAQVTTPE
jgi:tetratricopeptide (TPR) repeat protein